MTVSCNMCLCINHLSSLQFGFRPLSSTQEALLVSTRDWHDTLDRGGSVVCLFLDLAKAFDSIPHSLILLSLVRVGVRGALLRWFESYLSNRSQHVVLQGASSASVEVTSGVLQDSILGPLLFILAIDPLTRLSISSSGSIRIYADDAVYYKPVFKTGDLLAVQSDVDIISLWVDSNHLRFNVKTSKLMVISRKRSPPSLYITLKGSPVQQVSTYKYLGVLVSDDLSWTSHIRSTCC